MRNVCNIEAINKFTRVASKFTIEPKMRIAHIHIALREQLTEDLTQIEATYEEMNKLRSAYIRYKNLEEQRQRIQSRIQDTLGVLGAAKGQILDGLTKDEFVSALERAGIAGETVEEIRGELPLWAAIAQILRHAPELQIVNIQEFLSGVGIESSRQAVESALATHKDLFIVKKRGREKFVSLK
jgi:hypothetical protein